MVCKLSWTISEGYYPRTLKETQLVWNLSRGLRDQFRLWRSALRVDCSDEDSPPLAVNWSVVGYLS